MQIEIKLDENCKEPKIIVVTNKMTDEINEIMKRLSDEQPKMIAGFKDDIVEVLEPFDIYRIFAASGKVFAETNHGEYTLRLRLYEMEQRLDSNFFVRISNSDIINLRKVKGFDLSFAGTICVTLSNGTVTYVSRRFVAKIKQKMIQRGLLGFPLGIAIGFVITVIISMCIGDGSFYPVNPELIDTMKNELNAVILQTILCGILGTGFAMASVIWEIDSWSLAKQSGIYFSIACVTMFPIAYITNWMKHNAIGILSYVGIFVAIFVITWLVQYFVWKRKVKRMNDGVRKSNNAK